MRIRSTVTMLAAAGLLAACGADDDPQEQDAAPEDGAEDLEDPEGDIEDLEDGLEDGDLEDMMGDLEDPNEFVSDGVFRGQGVVLPVPEGFELDEMAFAQGAIVAAAGTSQQLAAEAVDTADLPDEQAFDYDELIEQNLTQIPEEPASDEEVDLDGAAQARALRFDDLSAPEQPGMEDEEGQEAPATTAFIVFAEDGNGQLAVFNYLAESDEFDDDLPDELVAVAGFDDESDPEAPAPVEGP